MMFKKSIVVMILGITLISVVSCIQYNPIPQSFTKAQEEPSEIFKQCLDHFSSDGCSTTWDQRYWVQDDHYKPGGPVFVLFAGQGNGADWKNGFALGEYIEEYGAKFIAVEHRFYGESIPIINATTEDLEKYHGTRPAIADLANFIDVFKVEQNLTEADWVLFGGSYSSSLSIWFNQLYPGRFTTGVYSAGPLVFRYAFPEAAQALSKMLKEQDPECFDMVHEMFGCMESIVNGSGCSPYTGTSDMLKAIYSCDTIDFEDRLAAESFFSRLFNMWVAPPLFKSLKVKCDILRGINEPDILHKFGQFLNASGVPTCSSSEGVQPQSVSPKDIELDIQNIIFTTCTEIGTFYSSDTTDGLFGYNTFSGDVMGNDCAKMFGPKYTKEYIESRIEYTNTFYQGFNITSKCGIFVTGGNDPWYSTSIHDPSQISTDNTLVFMPNGEHMAETSELFFEQDGVLQAREEIKAQLGVYLNDPSCKPV